jgi:diguanylate cyclase (GGDEF)-like protein/PAS domain S-box-containing protein
MDDLVGLAASRVMFEHASEGMLFATSDGSITAANPAACALLALTEDEIRLLGTERLTDPEDPRWQIAVAERDRSGSAVTLARMRRGDGRFIELEVTTRRFVSSAGDALVFNVLRDVTSRIELERELQEISARLLVVSRTDELTGFQNRRGLIAAGTMLLQIADSQSSDVDALFMDVDNVKELNDTFGLQAGDAALQAVARALTVAFRKVDVLARIGGTTFLALAPNLGAERDAVTTRVLDHLAASGTIEFVGAPVLVSYGWTSRLAGERCSLEELVERSDRAMLEARAVRRAAGGDVDAESGGAGDATAAPSNSASGV